MDWCGRVGLVDGHCLCIGKSFWEGGEGIRRVR